MKKLSLIKESCKMLSKSCLEFLQSRSIGKTLTFAVMAVILIFSSCKKDDDRANEELIKAETSLRLVHSSYNSSTSAVDVFVDDVKLNTSGTIAFPQASARFPISSGSKKIVVKTTAGASIIDTAINVGEGKQHTIFIKDRSLVDITGTIFLPLKTVLSTAIDNDTSMPAAGKAKVRFVNMGSQPLNATTGPITFLTVNAPGSATATTVTQTLGQDGRIFSSDYTSFDAGQITFRAQSVSPSIVDLTMTLEAGKLYTLFVVSTEHTVRTPTKSPISLKVLVNN